LSVVELFRQLLNT